MSGMVEDGVITSDNFRDFTFANAVHLWGTRKAAAEELARGATR
jgi:hypothetical protein